MLPSSLLSGGLDHLLLSHTHTPTQIFQNALCIVHSWCLVGSSSEAALVPHCASKVVLESSGGRKCAP